MWYTTFILLYTRKKEGTALFLADSHTHSVYSFDGKNTPLEMCAAAKQNGVSAFAVTDHVDIDCILDGLYPPYDACVSRRAIEAAASQYAGQVEIIRGIELGQPSLRPEESRLFLKENRFDFVIGSCHNLDGVPDFYFMRFEGMPEAQMISLFRRSIAQLKKTAAMDGIHTIAHPLYPLRYMARSGRSLSLSLFETDFCELFSVMLDSGVALELNMKAIRCGEEPWEWEDTLLRLWRDCGGRRVTCGTDAHKASDIGTLIAEGYEHLRAAGFESVLVPAVGGAREIPLSI